MEQPHGFIHDSSLVCRPKKSLYYLKQAPGAWYAKMDSFLLSQNFERGKYDPNVYMLRTHDSLLILVSYVDDLLITRSSAATIATVKRALHYRFLMKDMGPLHFFLGLEISQDATGIKLSEAKYAQDLTASQHRLLFCPGCALRMEELHELHWNASKRILRYVQGTITFGIHYAAGTALNLLGFTDSDWAGDNIDCKSTSDIHSVLGSGLSVGRARSKRLFLSL
eukprot:PITA_30106